MVVRSSLRLQDGFIWPRLRRLLSRALSLQRGVRPNCYLGHAGNDEVQCPPTAMHLGSIRVEDVHCRRVQGGDSWPEVALHSANHAKGISSFAGGAHEDVDWRVCHLRFVQRTEDGRACKGRENCCFCRWNVHSLQLLVMILVQVSNAAT